MNAIDLIYLFPKTTQVRLIGPDDEELYSGAAYRCIAWLMKNSQYDIFPDTPSVWADVQGDTLVVFLDEILE